MVLPVYDPGLDLRSVCPHEARDHVQRGRGFARLKGEGREGSKGLRATLRVEAVLSASKSFKAKRKALQAFKGLQMRRKASKSLKAFKSRKPSSKASKSL